MELRFLGTIVILESDLPMDIGKNAKDNLMDLYVEIKTTFMPTLPCHFMAARFNSLQGSLFPKCKSRGRG